MRMATTMSVPMSSSVDSLTGCATTDGNDLAGAVLRCPLKLKEE